MTLLIISCAIFFSILPVALSVSTTVSLTNMTFVNSSVTSSHSGAGDHFYDGVVLISFRISMATLE